MTAAEITDALVSRGIHLDPDDWSFMDSKRRLDFAEVLTLLPGAATAVPLPLPPTRQSRRRRRA